MEEESTSSNQVYEDVVLNRTWWWAVHLCLSGFALVANLIFLITVIYNRKRHELKTFVTAIIITIAVLDMVDVVRILPLLSQSLFYDSIFRHIYCSFGVFHELAVAIFLVALSIAVCVQAGKDIKYYSSDWRASLPQKILIPVVLLLSAGAAGPFFLIPYEKLGHMCIDPFKIETVLDTESKDFTFSLYSTIVTVFTYFLPVLIVPLSIPIASMKTCISKQCCVPRYKQPIGELVMVSVMSLIYLATVIGIILPRLDEFLEWGKVELGPAPLLWELANNCARPLCYFMMNPGVWEGLRILCCKRKNQLVNEDDEEIEVPLSPVTTV